MQKHLLPCSFVLLCLATCGRSPLPTTEPRLDLSPGVLRFSADVGQVVPPKTVSLVESHDLNAAWRASRSAPWVQVNPSHGFTPSTIQVTVSTRGLAPGLHRAGIAVQLADDQQAIGATAFVVELELSAPGWTALGGPFCGAMRSLAVNPDDPTILVAGDLEDRLWVSTDGGSSFFVGTSGSDPVNAITLLPGGRGYAGSHGLLRSDDGGVTWNGAGLANRQIDGLAVDPSTPDTVVVEGDGLWRSVDAGQSWEEVATPADSHCLAADPTSPGLVVVGGNGGAIYTVRGTLGSPLTVMTPTGYADEVRSLAVLPSGRWVAAHDVYSDETPALRVSDDDGLTWFDPGGAGLPASEDGVHLWLAVVDGALYGLHKGLYRSDDGGETFVELPFGLRNTRGGDRRFYAIAAGQEALLVAHQALGLVQVGAAATPLPFYGCAVRGLAVDAFGDLYGVLDPGGVFARRAGLFTGLSGSGGPNAERYNDLALDPRSSASMIIGSEDHSLYVTLDGGQSWTEGAVGYPGEDVRSVARAPDNPEVIWMAGSSPGVLRSADNGVSFATLAPAHVSHVAAISADEAIYYGDGLIRRVTAGGVITTADDPHDSVNFVGRTADGALWYCANDGLRRSRDEAQSFVNLGLSSTSVRDLVVDPADSTHVFVATGRGLFESRDDGGSWLEVPSPFSPTSLAWDTTLRQLYVGTSGGGVYVFQPQ